MTWVEQSPRDYDVRRRQSRPVMSGSSASSSGQRGANGGCGCKCHRRGSVTLFGVEWATTYDVEIDAAPLPRRVQVTYQEDYWESDDIETTCGDLYKIVMTPTGYLAGEIELTVEYVSGGGSGGEVLCCDGEDFAWLFINRSIVDPLCSMEFARDPSGFDRRDCYVGPCRVCVRPLAIQTTIECMETYCEIEESETYCVCDGLGDFGHCAENAGPFVYASGPVPQVLTLRGVQFNTSLVASLTPSNTTSGEPCNGKTSMSRANIVAAMDAANAILSSGMSMEPSGDPWWHGQVDFETDLTCCVDDSESVRSCSLECRVMPCTSTTDEDFESPGTVPPRAGIVLLTLTLNPCEGVFGAVSYRQSFAWSIHEFGSGATDLNDVQMCVRVDDYSPPINDMFEDSAESVSALVPESVTVEPAV